MPPQGGKDSLPRFAGCLSVLMQQGQRQALLLHVRDGGIHAIENRSVRSAVICMPSQNSDLKYCILRAASSSHSRSAVSRGSLPA